jgi:hypothetical protein
MMFSSVSFDDAKAKREWQKAGLAATVNTKELEEKTAWQRYVERQRVEEE